LIQGTLPRPSELEVYLGDTGIYYRKIDGEGEVPVPAGTAEVAPVEPAPGTLLFTF